MMIMIVILSVIVIMMVKFIQSTMPCKKMEGKWVKNHLQGLEPGEPPDSPSLSPGRSVSRQVAPITFTFIIWWWWWW